MVAVREAPAPSTEGMQGLPKQASVGVLLAFTEPVTLDIIQVDVLSESKIVKAILHMIRGWVTIRLAIHPFGESGLIPFLSQEDNKFRQ